MNVRVFYIHFLSKIFFMIMDLRRYSMSEIYCKMIELVGENNDVYTKRWLKTKLKNKYEAQIMFNEASRKSNVVCFKKL